MIKKDAVVEGSGDFDHLVLFNVHQNLCTRAYSISFYIENVAATARVQSRDLQFVIHINSENIRLVALLISF